MKQYKAFLDIRNNDEVYLKHFNSETRKYYDMISQEISNGKRQLILTTSILIETMIKYVTEFNYNVNEIIVYSADYSGLVNPKDIVNLAKMKSAIGKMKTDGIIYSHCEI